MRAPPLSVIVIQTALADEFSAIAAALEAPQTFAGVVPQANGQFEGQSVCVIRTGVGLRNTERGLTAWFDAHRGLAPRLLLSIGLCGALTPRLRVGDRLLIHDVQVQQLRGSAKIDSSSLRPAAAREKLNLPCARLVSLVEPAWTPTTKFELAANFGATICDMETAAVAAFAAERGLSWSGGRIVSDSAQERLPPWCVELAELVERRSWGRVAVAVASHPQDFPSLVRLAFRMHRLKRDLTHFTQQIIRAHAP